MNPVSAVLITYNEEKKIARALESLAGIADEIVVVDSFSTDATPTICRRYTDRVMQRPWAGYRAQKQFATDQASHPWVFSLDADEELSPELREEIQEWKCSGDDSIKGFYVPRKTWFLGRWIEHTTWYPDWQLRLFYRSAGVWKGGRLHESFQVEGKTGRLWGHLYHYTYENVSEYLLQLERFSALAAADARDRGVRAGWTKLTLHPAQAFLNNYLLRRGFLDGVPGLAVSVLAAVSTFFKYLKLWELQSERERDPDSLR